LLLREIIIIFLLDDYKIIVGVRKLGELYTQTDSGAKIATSRICQCGANKWNRVCVDKICCNSIIHPAISFVDYDSQRIPFPFPV
jgi:hypothetical protein